MRENHTKYDVKVWVEEEYTALTILCLLRRFLMVIGVEKLSIPIQGAHPARLVEAAS